MSSNAAPLLMQYWSRSGDFQAAMQDTLESAHNTKTLQTMQDTVQDHTLQRQSSAPAMQDTEK